MRRGLAILILLQSFSFASGQQEVRKYFDVNGIETESSNSYYYSIGKQMVVPALVGGTREIYIDTVKSYYSSTNKIRSKTVYDSNGALNGSFERYYENEKMKEKGIYLNGRRIGAFTNWYDNGNQSMTLHYPSKEERLNLPPIDFKIISYGDSVGNQLVKYGNGYCKCFLQEFGGNLLEQGKVVVGMRDSVWNGYENGTLIFTEMYDNGKFIEGINYYGGENYKYTQFEEPPQYIGGLEAMYKTVSKNTVYPKDARKARIQGAVYVSFIVRGDGSTSDHQVVKGIGKSCDDEALRVVKLLNNWNPGRQRGTPVNVKFVFPLNFKL